MKNLRERLEEAAAVIRGGGVIIYPTETVYGIGCNPFDEKAVKRVIMLKRREDKPHPVLASSLDDVLKVSSPSEEEIRLAGKLWPGPVTLVLEKRPELPGAVTFGQPSVGVRIPAHLIALELVRLAGTPIIGTSANVTGEPPAWRLELVAEELRSGVDMLVDGGVTRYREPSTVLKLVGDNVKIIREGAMKRAELREILSSTPYSILDD
ncbi:MAG: L-threonylcarbamoyladenylate synthase [Nitrososphaerota archaeon]